MQALSNALMHNRLHHAYLFTGTRGVGKTTIARIFAKSLNCATGITATPCGVCSACTEIDNGRFVDMIELDAASNTQVDNMRELLEGALYSPTIGRFKVYIIDEVHMLSKSAFNAMLKTLEEPPAHPTTPPIQPQPSTMATVKAATGAMAAGGMTPALGSTPTGFRLISTAQNQSLKLTFLPYRTTTLPPRNRVKPRRLPPMESQISKSSIGTVPTGQRCRAAASVATTRFGANFHSLPYPPHGSGCW